MNFPTGCEIDINFKVIDGFFEPIRRQRLQPASMNGFVQKIGKEHPQDRQTFRVQIVFSTPFEKHLALGRKFLVDVVKKQKHGNF